MNLVRFSLFFIAFGVFLGNGSALASPQATSEEAEVKKLASQILKGSTKGATKEEMENILDYHHLAENILNGKDVKKSTKLLKEKLEERAPAILGGFFDTPEMIRGRFHWFLRDLPEDNIELDRKQKKLIVAILNFCEENIKEYERRMNIAWQREKGNLILNEERISNVVQRNHGSLSPAAEKLWEKYLARKLDFRPAGIGWFVYGGRKNLAFRTLQSTDLLVQKVRANRLKKVDLVALEAMLRLLRYDLEVMWLDDLSIQTVIQDISPPTEFDKLSKSNCEGILRPMELLKQKSLPPAMNFGMMQQGSGREIAFRKKQNRVRKTIWGIPILPSDRPYGGRRRSLSKNPHTGGTNWWREVQLAEAKSTTPQFDENRPYSFLDSYDKELPKKRYWAKIQWLEYGPDTQRFDKAIKVTTKLLGENANFPWPKDMQKSAFDGIKKPKYKDPFGKLHYGK